MSYRLKNNTHINFRKYATDFHNFTNLFRIKTYETARKLNK